MQWGQPLTEFDRVFHTDEIPVADGRSAESDLLNQLIRIGTAWSHARTEKACTIYRSRNGAGWEIQNLGEGSERSVSPDVKAMIRRIVMDECTAIILCHNHPCGSTQPSETDLRATRDIARICRTLGVPLIDHIIFGKTLPFSFRRAGYL